MNDKKWEIDTINYNGWYLSSFDGADFIIELVHEIERLQTENIRLKQQIEFNDYADAMYADGMTGVYGGVE